MTEEKLKPCPFCGAEANHWPYGGDYHNEYINCSKCDAQIGEPVSWPAKEVIKQWNTRASSNDTESREKIIEFLEAANATLKAELQKREWISVEDQVPDYTAPVLLFVDLGNDCDPIITTGYYDHRAEKYVLFDDGGQDCGDEVTHWMELPEPPLLPKGEQDD